MLKTVDLGYDIYQLVRDGKWTISKMLEAGSNFTYDLNGDSVLGPADNRGIAGTTKVNFQMMITGSGIKFIETNTEGNPYFTLSNDTVAVEKLSKIIDLYKSSNAYYNNNTDPSGGIVPTEFDNGTVFMLASTVWNITDYRDNTFKVGVMPSPKFDENQERYYSVSVGGVIPLIPKITTDERAGNVSMILEGMSSYSAQYLVPVYKEEILQAKYADAPDDSDMIDLIFRTQTFDFGVMVWAYDIRTPLMRDIFHTLSPNIASYLKQLSKGVDIMIKATITALEK
jgi:ABC-type glycerol-3-phosphate transport system substrate-binding protein